MHMKRNDGPHRRPGVTLVALARIASTVLGAGTDGAGIRRVIPAALRKDDRRQRATRGLLVGRPVEPRDQRGPGR